MYLNILNINLKKIFLKELYRKTLHLSSSIIPLSCIYISENLMLKTIIMLLIIMFAFETNRILCSPLYARFKSITKKIGLDIESMLRIHESQALTGASYMIISMAIVCCLFLKIIFIQAFLILAISDSLAALVGIGFGRIKLFDKTLEGFLTFWISTICIIYLVCAYFNYEIEFISIFIISGITAIAELLSKQLNIDDNLSVPIIFSIIFSLFS